MTDNINFGSGLGPINRINGQQKTADCRPRADKGPVDRVDFSSVLQEVSRAREVPAPVDSERVQKLALLKAQIADGSYRPDLEKVAVSLIDFLAGVK
ncbi:MAG: flagellar biosynthesis anti-sigma factor FlgM [Desulfobacterales bacterium]|nr:flagellar biosynthesis anti-sigma factor FlgM [Desulfobacterales bacterium]